MNHINFLMLGLGNGAVFAALAMALVVTYRSSGVLNFATGAIALYGAYLYALLRRSGTLLQLVPGFGHKIQLNNKHPWPFLPSLILAIAVSALLGVVLYALIFRPLRNAVPTAKAVASLGVMVLFTGLVSRAAGSEQILVKPIFSEAVYHVGSVRLNGDRLWFAATVVAIAAVLAALYRFTTFGLATRASSETDVGAIVTGLKPERIAIINWAISAGVSGLTGILIAPLTPLVPGTYTLFIVPALAAAVLGRFSMLAPAVVGGLAIGMLQSEAVNIHSTYSWTLSSGNAELIPLVLVLVVLLVKGRPLPTRGTLLQQTLGKSPRPRNVWLPTAIFVPATIILLIATSGSIRGAVILSMIMAVISLSLVVVTGYAGQISLAQLSLAGVGGFLLSRFTDGMGIPFPIAPVLAALGAMVLGVVVGLPAIRIRGLLVGIVTFVLAIALEAVWFKNLDINGGDKSAGGASGSPIKDAKFLGIDLRVGVGRQFPRIEFGIMVLIVLTITCLGVAWLRSSRLGAAMLAVRANERSAAAAGISVVQVKMIAFGIGAFIAGIGGSLLAYKQGSITFESYAALAGLGVLATSYVAGITSIQGAIMAGVLAEGGLSYVIIDRNFKVGTWYGIVSGLGLIITVLKNPEGIVGPTHELIAKIRDKRENVEGEPEAVRTRETGARVVPEPGQVLLEVSNLSVRYGGVTAVSDVSFSVRTGQIVGLIGPNGAGKTTSMDALSGFTDYTGAISLNGVVLDGLAPHQRVAKGLGRTFQGIDLYEDLSVAENIAVGQHVAGERGAAAEASLHYVLDMLGLTRIRNKGVAELSQGERQLVSIARALACKPKLLLLDEPAAGLDTTESLWLADRLHEIRSSGITILLVDHDMSLVLGLCDEIHVLDFGAVIASGTPEQIRTNPMVAHAYLGSSATEASSATTVPEATA